MKLAISISGNNPESFFEPRFGRATAFCVVDSETNEWASHPNPAISDRGGAGVRAAQFIASLGAQAIVSGAYGPNAFRTLSPAGIELYLAPADQHLTAADVLGMFREGQLNKAERPTHAGHHTGRH